ncbi:hypothetical protein [Paludisphaera mucosa]|uniref:Uncharacterized protein n=1 Tax=Paludisphaera mucosa TaxID=3030827 RepID=A0ABT6F4V5_9BACT|nr:hypothetical protein [Paludisphaera mucosa]MDG3002449.1 hypothetical protein [Paludisphaera mucosa]
MAYAIDSDFAIDAKHAGGAPPGRITLGFNVALFAFVSLVGVGRFLFASPLSRGASLEGVVFSCLLDMVRVLVVVLISSAFLKAFWGRLVATVWPVRAITLGESFAIVMMLSLLFGT